LCYLNKDNSNILKEEEKLYLFNTLIKLLNEEDCYFRIPKIFYYLIKNNEKLQKISIERDIIKKLSKFLTNDHFFDEDIKIVLFFLKKHVLKIYYILSKDHEECRKKIIEVEIITKIISFLESDNENICEIVNNYNNI
jgi:hypothetical protein